MKTRKGWVRRTSSNPILLEAQMKKRKPRTLKLKEKRDDEMEQRMIPPLYYSYREVVRREKWVFGQILIEGTSELK